MTTREPSRCRARSGHGWRDLDRGGIWRAERTSLLSLGDDQCRFAVLETDDPLAGYIDKLDERLVDKQKTG